RRENVEGDICEVVQSARHGDELRIAPARANDDGAVATWCLHQIGPIAGNRQHSVSRAATIARQVWRAVASVPRFYGKRCQCAAHQPWDADTQIERACAS